MEANKPLRQSKRKRKPPTSSENGRVDTSKRSKREHGEMPPHEPSPVLREEQPVDTGDSSVAPEFVDTGDNVKGLQQMKHDGEGTSSDSAAEKKDVMKRISRFPDLIQDKIFGYLNVRDKVEAAKVCPDWRCAVYKPRLWRHQKVSVDMDRITEEELQSLSEREIRQIEIKGRNKNKLKVLLKAFPSLVSLHLDSIGQTDIFFQKVSECEFSCLKDLSVVIEHVPRFLQRSVSRLSNLSILSLQGRVTSGHVRAIATELHGLEELSLHFMSGGIGRGDISMRELNSLRCLRSLSLRQVALFDLADFCQRNARLKVFRLRSCLQPEGDLAEDLARVTSLEELRLQNCSPGSLEPLQNLVNLKKLYLWPAKDGHWLSVAKISSLEDVFVELTGEVTIDMIHVLGSSLPRLKALTIYGIRTVPPEVLVYLACLPSLQSLHILNLRTSNFLKTLSEVPCNLRSLHMKHVKLTSSLELKHLAQISSLHEVVLHNMEVSCSGLSSLQQKTFQLATLELLHCGVSVEDLMPLLQTQTSLRKLVMEGYEVRKEDLPSPYAVLPNLEVCELSMFRLAPG